MLVTYRGYEVGGGGGHSGSGGGGGIPECFVKEGPHHSVAGEEEATTQQPQRDVELEETHSSSPTLKLRSVVYNLINGTP